VVQLNAQGFNEGRGKSFSAHGILFTSRNDILYVIAIGWRIQLLSTKALGANAKNMEKSIANVDVQGSQELIQWA
jgi:alpha-L-fucosidase